MKGLHKKKKSQIYERVWGVVSYHEDTIKFLQGVDSMDDV
jgi:hypothetical protein